MMVTPPVWYVTAWLGLSCWYFAFWNWQIGKHPRHWTVAFAVLGFVLVGIVLYGHRRA